MPVIEGESGEQLSEKFDEGEGSVHTHYTSGVRYAITMYEHIDMDDEYDGEPYSCPLCEFTVDYPEDQPEGYSYHYDVVNDVYVCDYDGCGWEHELEQQVKSHQTRVHGD